MVSLMNWRANGLAVGGPLAYISRPLWLIVRNFRRVRAHAVTAPQRLRHKPKRAAPAPVAPAAIEIEEVVAGLDTKRKRKASDEAINITPMIDSKRRRLDYDSPWSKEKWAIEHSRRFNDIKHYQVHSPPRSDLKKFYQEYVDDWSPHPVTSRISPVRQWARKSPPRHLPYSKPSPKRRPEKVHLGRTPPQPFEFFWSDESEDELALSSPAKKNGDPKLDSNLADIDKDGLKGRDFSQIMPTLPKEQVYMSPIAVDDSKSQNSDDLFDAQEEAEFRAYLRARPDSYDELGYRLPIDRVLSPPSLAFNEAHKTKVEVEAAVALETPSRPPKDTMSSPLPGSFPGTIDEDETNSPSIESLVEEAKSTPLLTPKLSSRRSTSSSSISPKTDIGMQSPTPAPKSMKEEKEDDLIIIDDEKPSPEVKSESIESTQTVAPSASKTSPASALKAEKAADTQSDEAPAGILDSLRKLEGFQIGTPIRTPKAHIFNTIRTDRKTRLQRAIEEREAAKDQYKIVRLSKEWDDRVRDAVRNGSADGRYEPRDFARVVPQYSGNPGQDCWLNDAVINDYVTLCVKHGNKGDRSTQPVPTCTSLSSFFYSKIVADPTSVPASWTRRAKIQGKKLLDCEKIFIPINQGAHWTLCVVEPKKHKRITVYNSMGHSRNQQVADVIIAWVKHELGNSFKEEEWTINARGISPQQTNGDDCGVFAITTARQIMLDRMEKTPYTASVIHDQRRRIVAELINGGLLKADES